MFCNILYDALYVLIPSYGGKSYIAFSTCSWDILMATMDKKEECLGGGAERNPGLALNEEKVYMSQFQGFEMDSSVFDFVRKISCGLAMGLKSGECRCNSRCYTN